MFFPSENCTDSEEQGRPKDGSEVLRVSDFVAVERDAFGQLRFISPCLKWYGGTLEDDILVGLMVDDPRHLFLGGKYNREVFAFCQLHQLGGLA